MQLGRLRKGIRGNGHGPCRKLLTFAMVIGERGRSSVVEHQLPKLSVVGSIPIARSNLRAFRRFGWQANCIREGCPPLFR